MFFVDCCGEYLKCCLFLSIYTRRLFFDLQLWSLFVQSAPIALLFFNSSKHKDGLVNTDLMLSSQSAEQKLCEVLSVKKGIHPQIRIRMEIKIVFRCEQMRTRGIWGSGGEGIQVQLCPMKEEKGAGVASGDSSQVARWSALPFGTKQV